jgi:hypothetical protein
MDNLWQQLASRLFKTIIFSNSCNDVVTIQNYINNIRYFFLNILFRTLLNVTCASRVVTTPSIYWNLSKKVDLCVIGFRQDFLAEDFQTECWGMKFRICWDERRVVTLKWPDVSEVRTASITMAMNKPRTAYISQSVGVLMPVRW